MNNGENHNHFPLTRRPSSAIEKAAPGAKIILSGMVADALVLAKKRPPPKIVVMDENSYPLEFMELVIKKWFKNVVLEIFRDRNEALQRLPLLNPDLLIVDTGIFPLSGGRDKKKDMPFQRETLQSLVDRKITYPIVVTCAFESSIHIVNLYSSKGLKITFLPKPFTSENFIEILEANLKISRDSI